MVRFGPSPNSTTGPRGCWAEAGRRPASVTTASTASPEHHASRVLMTFPPRVKLRERHSSFHRPHGEALDEAIDEEIVDDGKWNADDQGGGHERPPVVHVAADQRDRHAQAYGHFVDRAEEGQRIHELLHHQREAENDYRQDARNDEPRRDFHDDGEPAVPVDHRLLLDLPGDRAEEPHDQPGAKWNGDGGVDEDQGAERVLQAEERHDPREWDEEQRRGDQIGEEDPHAEPLAPAAGE